MEKKAEQCASSKSSNCYWPTVKLYNFERSNLVRCGAFCTGFRRSVYKLYSTTSLGVLPNYYAVNVQTKFTVRTQDDHLKSVICQFHL